MRPLRSKIGAPIWDIDVSSLALDASRLADVWRSFLSSWLAPARIGAVSPFVLQ
jgi:hypothetical protein